MKWHVESDLDYYDWLNHPGGHHYVKRTCDKCGQDLWISKQEPYVMKPWCDECLLNVHTQRQEETR